MEKINISKIFRDHFLTFRKYDDKKISYSDIFLFVIIPILLGLISYKLIRYNFLSSISSELITFYSIFGGFMLNVMALIYNYDIDKFKSPDIAKVVLVEIRANLAYLISIASISIMFLILLRIIDSANIIDKADFYIKCDGLIPVLKGISVSLVISLLSNFCLTIFMALKRFYSLDCNKK